MKILTFKDFMKKYNLKNDAMIESELQRNYKYPINPRGSQRISDKEFVNFDDGSMGGSHLVCFIVKDKKSFYYDSFGGQLDKILLKQIPKPIIYHIYETQGIYFKLCGSYCLYFFYSIERMNYYDTFLKMHFYKIL